MAVTVVASLDLCTWRWQGQANKFLKMSPESERHSSMGQKKCNQQRPCLSFQEKDEPPWFNCTWRKSRVSVIIAAKIHYNTKETGNIPGWSISTAARDSVPFEAKPWIWFPNHLHRCTLFLLLLFCPSHRFSNTMEQFSHCMWAWAGSACFGRGEGELGLQWEAWGKSKGEQGKAVTLRRRAITLEMGQYRKLDFKGLDHLEHRWQQDQGAWAFNCAHSPRTVLHVARTTVLKTLFWNKGNVLQRF